MIAEFTACEQTWRNETVAEPGGTVLLCCLGQDHDADLGGCWEYITSWSRHDIVEPIQACRQRADAAMMKEN